MESGHKLTFLYIKCITYDLTRTYSVPDYLHFAFSVTAQINDRHPGDRRLHRVCKNYGEWPLRDMYGRILRCAYCIPPCPYGSRCRQAFGESVCCSRYPLPFSGIEIKRKLNQI